MAFSKSVNIAHAQRAVPCDVCEDEVPGEYYCIECKHTLCPPCEKLHKKFTKGHNVVLRSQIGDIHTTILTCADHGEQASCHCEKCDIPVCIKCVTGKHTGHTMSDLADAVEKEKKLLQDDIEALQRDLSTMKKKRGKIRMEKENYKKKIEKMLKDMKDENQAAIEKLQRLYKERVVELTTIQDSDLAIFDVAEEEMKSKIITYEKRISEYEDTIAKNSLPALKNVTKGKPSMLEIKTKFKLPDPPLFVPGDLQSIVENMGKLHISPSSLMAKPLKLVSTTMVSKFHCQLQGNPRICITKDGDIWLGGYESRELVMVDIKGQVLRRRTIQNRPYSLAVMDCGDVIISPHSDDSRSVSRLLKDGREQHVFDASPSLICGVSVTADQKLLICMGDGRVVMTNGDGTNVKQIYKGPGEWSAVHAVENADGNVYVSDKKNSAVVMISKHSRGGTALSTISHTTEGKQLGWPCGLFVDKLGNILCADSKKNIIYITGQNQQIRELVGLSYCMEKPEWLAADNDDNLWITQRNGTVHVVRYLSQ